MIDKFSHSRERSWLINSEGLNTQVCTCIWALLIGKEKWKVTGCMRIVSVKLYKRKRKANQSSCDALSYLYTFRPPNLFPRRKCKFHDNHTGFKVSNFLLLIFREFAHTKLIFSKSSQRFLHELHIWWASQGSHSTGHCGSLKTIDPPKQKHRSTTHKQALGSLHSCSGETLLLLCAQSRPGPLFPLSSSLLRDLSAFQIKGLPKHQNNPFQSHHNYDLTWVPIAPTATTAILSNHPHVAYWPRCDDGKWTFEDFQRVIVSCIVICNISWVVRWNLR